MSTIKTPQATSAPRRRLSRENRGRQLLDVAWQLVRDEGTDALTLGRLAEQAGITKPVVYDHFTTRSGLLAALYQDFDARQTRLMDEALEQCEPTLTSTARLIAWCYVECVLLQGSEISGVIAALAGSPEMEKIKREYEAIFLTKCRNVLAPFAQSSELRPAGLRAMLGAADALSNAAANGEISAADAQQELFEIILGMVARNTEVGP